MLMTAVMVPSLSVSAAQVDAMVGPAMESAMTGPDGEAMMKKDDAMVGPDGEAMMMAMVKEVKLNWVEKRRLDRKAKKLAFDAVLAEIKSLQAQSAQSDNDELAQKFALKSKYLQARLDKRALADAVFVGGAAMIRSRDIVDNAVLAPNVTTVVAAVGAAGLVDTLKSEGPFTVFAPDNNAFAKLPAGTVETLLKPENKATLAGILTYHVVAGKLTSDKLMDGAVLTTVHGGKLTVKVGADESISLVDEKGGVSKVITADVISTNGVTHVIDSVLLPN